MSTTLRHGASHVWTGLWAQERGTSIAPNRRAHPCIRANAFPSNPLHSALRCAFQTGSASSCGRCCSLEDWDLARPMARTVITPPQGAPQLPDLPNWSWHEYGMRVAFWRMRKMYERVGATPTVAINARICETYPEVVAACSESGWELNAHSYEQIPMHKLDDQRAIIAKTMSVIERFSAKRPRGWFGPGLTQTFDTVDHLAEAGIEYIGDYVLDDDPVTLKTKHGPIVALPYTFEVHDIVMMNLQHLPSEAFHARAMDHFRCLYGESTERAKIMAISCHP